MKKKKRNTLSITGTLDVLAIGLTIATIMGFLGRWHWTLDLFSHFRVQFMQLCLILIGLSIWKRRNKRAVAALLLVVVNYALVLPLYFGKPDPAETKPARAMLMNLNAANSNTRQVLEAIRKFDPDLLLLLEVTPHWATELSALEPGYPYSIAEPQTGCFGILLLSKHPLHNERLLDIGQSGVPSVSADVYFPQGEISVIGTHPVPPVGADSSRRRNDQLAALPEVVKAQQHPVLLIGDLNTSPWSPYFTDLARDSGLKNSMKGFGFQPTWPEGIPFMKIPLDHVLHSPEIIVHNRWVGEDMGSDHRPVIVDFSIR